MQYCSGHCVYLHGAYAENIIVTFPGHEYIQDSNDCGLIILSGNSNEGFGWSAIVPDNELLKSIVNNCGYPVDKHTWPQMWTTGGELTEVTTNRFLYMNDKMPGESGSSVHTWYKDCWTVLSLHSYAYYQNSTLCKNL